VQGVRIARTGRLALALAVSAGVAGCQADPGAPDAFPTGGSEQTLDVEGVERGYRAFVPEGLTEPAPLVLMLHGGGGSARQAERSYGWTELAREERFVVLHPEGLHRTWNSEGGCCGRAESEQVDDVAFLEALIEAVSDEVPIDADRVFVTGMSNGAMMAYTLVCRTDAVAAIAPVAGTMLDDCAEPRPVSVHHVHGLLDQSVRYDGSPGTGVAQVDGPSIPDVLDFWRTVNGCLAPTVVTAGPVQRTVARCSEGRSVELVTVEDAGHQWPGSETVRGDADEPSSSLDATEEIWRFFAAHPRPDDA
jgi:polyhydroxybutyrate depolymerase